MNNAQALPFGRFKYDHERFRMFNDILNTYLEHNVSGGSLHIYLDDGNKGVSNLEFCRNYAFEHKDWIGVYLCDEFLYYGEKFIDDYIDYDIHVAYAFWEDNKRKEEMPPVQP